MFKGLEVLMDYGEVNVSVIKIFEEEFNINLPNLFVSLMLKHNGAYLKNGGMYYNNGDVATFSFYGFKTEENNVLEDISTQYLYDDPIYGYPHVYSFGSTGNGDFICFDYRDNPNGNEPKVCIVIHDEYDDITGKHLLFPIANSFEEFLEGLFDFDELYPDDFDID